MGDGVNHGPVNRIGRISGRRILADSLGREDAADNKSSDEHRPNRARPRAEARRRAPGIPQENHRCAMLLPGSSVPATQLAI